MRIISIALLGLIFISCIFAQDESEKNLKIKLEQAALFEFKALNLDAESKERITIINECEVLYNAILSLTNDYTEEDVKKNHKFISRAIDRSAWFLFRNHSKEYDIFYFSDLLLKAIKLDEINYIAHYKYAMIHKTNQINLYREHLLKAFELKNDFAEVNFELGFCFYNNSREPDLVKKHQALFFQNMKNYIPELCYFDIGFPAKKIEQFVGLSEEEIKMLKRKEYYEIKDKSRFELNILKVND